MLQGGCGSNQANIFQILEDIFPGLKEFDRLGFGFASPHSSPCCEDAVEATKSRYCHK